MHPAISITDLDFMYPGQEPRPLFQRLSLQVPGGARCLLLGQNGVGKTTLLRILGGKHLVPRDAVRVLSASAFHDTWLCQRVAFLGGPFPFDVDMAVREILERHCQQEPSRGQRGEVLLEVLEIDPGWRMHQLSSGQRRRVQVLLGLLDPVDVVLLDEVTADLDVLSRADLLGLLRRESEGRGVTVLYATHVLDGLERWATHLCLLCPGPAGTRVRLLAPLDRIDELRTSSLLQLCEGWMREDRAYLRGAPSGHRSR